MSAESEAPLLSSSNKPADGSPGMAIRAARERAGLTLEDLATRTRITRPVLDAMENDDYAQLLEPVYARGYYRKCATALGIDEKPLMDAYQAAYRPKPASSAARLQLVSGGERNAANRRSRSMAVIAPIVAILVCAVIWVLLQQSPSPTAPETNNTSTPIPVDPATPVEGLASDTLPPVEMPVDGSAPAITPEVAAEAQAVDDLAASGALDPNAPAPDAGAPPVTVTEPTAQPTSTKLVLNFSAISWARVEDATGKSLLSGVMGVGERHEVEGKPPYSIFLGNAPGVKMEFGGQPVDLRPLTQGNSTARFSVPVAGR